MKRWLMLALCALPRIAGATDWTILDMGTQRCISARAFAANSGVAYFRSPLALRSYLRYNPDANAEMGYIGTKVHHLGDGGIMAVVKTRKNNMYYFSSRDDCHLFKKIAIADGAMPNLNELR